MRGMVDRRNHRAYWAGRITWQRLKLKTLPVCDDCLLNVHSDGGTTERVPRARWRRINTIDTDKGPILNKILVCDVHHQDWVDWTPGQMVMPT